MKITHLKVNHLVNPMGYDLKRPSISYVAEETAGKHQAKAQVKVALDEAFQEVIYDSGESAEIVSTGYVLPVETKPEDQIFLESKGLGDNGDVAESEAAWFETGKGGVWEADWITPKADKELQVSVEKTITVDKPVKHARMYTVGLGLYELYLNGEKQGDECLLPGYCDYDTWIQYQTFALDLKQGENKVEMLLGDGWYKGWFGLRQHFENYGDRLACIGEIHIEYEDGTKETICTDTSWKARKSKVVYSGIYPGEVYDATLDTSEVLDDGNH